MTPEQVMEEMRAHYSSRREDFMWNEMGDWLVRFGELQVRLAEAIVAQSRRPATPAQRRGSEK
jgi:hypothetical protein